MWRAHSLKRPWYWERLKEGQGDNRGWDGWMASPTQWTQVWVNSRSWWWTGRPGVLQSMGSQRVGHDERLNSTEWFRRWRICLQLRRPGFDPWVGRIPGEGNSYPLQYSCLKNCVDRRAWWATVHEVAKSRTWLSYWQFHFHNIWNTG